MGMTDLLIFASPFGTLALAPDQVCEAVVRANESRLALCCEDEPTSAPGTKNVREQWPTVHLQKDVFLAPYINKRILNPRESHQPQGLQHD